MFLYQVGQRADGVCHDGQDIVEGLPGLGQLEDSEKPEGSQDREAADAVGQKFHEREQDDDEVEDVPAVLEEEEVFCSSSVLLIAVVRGCVSALGKSDPVKIFSA